MKNALIIAYCLLVAGCDHEQRIVALEKQNQELKGDLAKNKAVADFDLQGKCSKDASVWFNDFRGSGDKDTLLLQFTNHYNKAQNKCFILIEYHYTFGPQTWMNDQSVWDVYENVKYADFVESHTNIFVKDNVQTHELVSTCEVYGKKCATHEEFAGLARPYMND